MNQTNQDVIAIWDNESAAVFSLDEKWHFTSVNDECVRLFKREPETLLGHNIWEEFPFLRDSCFEIYQQAMASQRGVTFQLRCEILNTWVLVRAEPLPSGLQIRLRRISGPNEVVSPGPFQQAILDALTSHIAVLDEQGVIVTVNKAWHDFAARNYAVPISSGVGANYLQVCDTAQGLWGEEAPMVAGAIRDILAGSRDYFELEYPCHGPQEQRWFRVRITQFQHQDRVHVVVDHKNITEQRLLAEERDQLRRTAEAALEHVNSVLEEGVRQRTAELEQTNKRLKGEVAERQMVMGQLREVVTQLESAKTEAERLQKNAEVARHEAEVAREEAEAANHSKSEFLSRMSHELRTPLNAILGFGQLLQMDTTLPPKRRNNVDHILKAGEHLLNLINEVLDISRIEVGNLSLSIEPVPANQAVHEAFELMRPLAAPGNITLIDNMPGNLRWHVMADRQRLKQVLLNLVSNAIKYNRQGGSVTISCIHNPDEGKLRLLVSDTGSGLSESDLGKLFTPFERLGATMTRIEGTGIGLVLSQRLTEAMGGKLGVESTPGRGSTFWLDLPVAQSPIDGAQSQLDWEENTPQSIAEEGAPRYTVLYIEDNLPNLELVEMLLENRADVRLISAVHAGKGLELAIEHQPALILLDFHLPDMNGDELLRRLQVNPETQHIPVIIISADATPGQIQRGLAAGAKAYLTKPINVKQFIQTVDENLK